MIKISIKSQIMTVVITINRAKRAIFLYIIELIKRFAVKNKSPIPN